MSDKVTRLPCQTYLNDIPESLREMARQIERGEMATPDLMVTVTSDKDGLELFAQGRKADDNVSIVGALSLGHAMAIETTRNDIEASKE